MSEYQKRANRLVLRYLQLLEGVPGNYSATYTGDEKKTIRLHNGEEHTLDIFEFTYLGWVEAHAFISRHRLEGDRE